MDGAGRRGDWTAASAWALAMLTLISSFNYLDRSILGLVLPLIKAEMHLSDTVLGLVSGLAFVLFYTLLGLPIAWAADRYNRRNIVALGLAFWSVMTAVTGLVANVWQLALTRFLMGAGEAACLAPSQSMLGDLFSPRSRGLAIAIFGTAFAIASLVYYPLIGMVSEAHGWRAAFIAGGIPGLAVALVFVLTVREPARGGAESRPERGGKAGTAQTLRYMHATRTYLLILGGVTFMGANVFAAGTWGPTFLERVHGLSVGEIANIIGPVRGILGMVGVLAGGWLADRLGARDPRWRMWVPGLLCLAVVPSEAMFLLFDPREVWIAGLALTSLFTFAHQGPIYAVVLTVVPLRMRAIAVAVLILCSSLLGQVFGPLFVGMLNDWLAADLGVVAIRYSLAITIACAFVTGCFFMLGASSYDRDARRAAEAMAGQGGENQAERRHP